MRPCLNWSLGALNQARPMVQDFQNWAYNSMRHLNEG